MRTLAAALLLLVAFVMTASGLQAQIPRDSERAVVTFPALLDRMVDVDWLMQPPPTGERCVQFSSYDRRSDNGPGQAADWYANRDWGNFLRVEERAGKKEHVMLDCKGPGTIVRIWSANPKGVLHFYVDAAETPTYSIGFQELCGGKKAPFEEPLAGVRARGWNCHVPFPFAKSMKLTCSEGGFYYQVNARLYGTGRTVESFQPGLLVEHGAKLASVAKALAADREDVASLAAHEDHVSKKLDVDAGREAVTQDLWGKGMPDQLVRCLYLRPVPAKGSVYSLRDFARACRLVVRTEQSVMIDAPLSDFFATGPDWRPYRSYLFGVQDDGFAYCYLPMPLPEEAWIELLTQSPGEERLQGSVELALRSDRVSLPKSTLLLHANWHERRGIKTRPRSDHRVLSAKGAGRYVGCSLVVGNRVRAWWGEGDEKFYVDGEDFPSTFGTGTEDYFGYAWCSNQLFASAFHAQSQCDGPRNFGYTCVSRLQVLDMVPFQESFVFDLEVWHGSRRAPQVHYASTAYWYGGSSAYADMPEPGPASAHRYPPLEPPNVIVVKGAIEGESLARLSLSGGELRRQAMGTFEEGVWSKDTQLWWIKAKPGDKLGLAVPVPGAGRYELRLRLTRANDYAIVQASLNGKRVGKPIDCYAPDVGAMAELNLGTFTTGKKDPLRLEFEIVGKNPRAEPGYMLGLDYVKLVRKAR